MAVGPRLEHHPESLRELGWRQGCRVELKLPALHFEVEGGQLRQVVRDVDEWLLVTQDCDLAWNAIVGSDSLVELRPILAVDPPSDWGIRSARLKLSHTDDYLHADMPNLRVTPEVLTIARHLSCPVPEDTQRIKTWLGLRYDRPAVPDKYLDLSKRIADQAQKKRRRIGAALVRDLLAVFKDTAQGVIEYELIAVLPRAAVTAQPSLVGEVDDWLADLLLSIPETLGVSISARAYPDDRVSLAVIESSYSLDVTTLSWPRDALGPVGAI